MSSEKLRYLKSRPPAPFQREDLLRGLAKLGVEKLAEIFVTAADYSEPLHRIALIYAAFATVEYDPTKMESAINYILDIDGWVPHKDEGAYALILGEMKGVLSEVGTTSPTLANRLIDCALKKARIMPQ